MLKTTFKALLGSHHKREAKKLQPLVAEINEIYDGLSALNDERLRAKTDEFRAYIKERTADLEAEIEELKEEKRHSEDPVDRERLSFAIGSLEADLLETLEATLEDLLPDAFAVVKETCRRLVGTEVVVTRWAPLPARALRYRGIVATSVLPSPVAISATLPR